QCLELIRTLRIEAAACAPAQSGDLFERIPRYRIVPLMKHEGRHTEQAHLAGLGTDLVDVLFERVADEDQRVHAAAAAFLDGMTQHPADLRLSTEASHGRHLPGERGRVGNPRARLALTEAAIEDELHVQPAERAGSMKHLRLDLAGSVPSGPAAGGGIHRENEPAALCACSR